MKVFSVLVPGSFFGNESGDMVEAASLQIEDNRPQMSSIMDFRGDLRMDAAEYLAHSLRLAADHIDTERHAV